MKLHLLGIFNSIHEPAYSHCAFTDKCLRFPKMMQAQGFDVIEYSNEGSQSTAREKVVILNRSEFQRLTELYKKEFPDHPSNVTSTLGRTFQEKLIRELVPRAEPFDIVCHPFGIAHASLGAILPRCFHVETGIGYRDTCYPYKIFESYAWWHYHQGRDKRAGNNYEWVIPMSYDLEDWEPCYEPGEYILYFGRIVWDKGLAVVKEIARHTDREVILCGKGDPSPWLDPAIKNLRAIPPVSGKARNALLRKAYCILMPTMYTEPFGSGGVEGMLCGTPFIASDFGAFSETVCHGVTGFRCKTLGDWVHAVEQAQFLDRKLIAEFARQKHSIATCGKLYAKVFQQVQDLKGEGWYRLTPIMAIPPGPCPDHRVHPEPASASAVPASLPDRSAPTIPSARPSGALEKAGPAEPLVSVIIPHFNGADYLVNAVQSVLAQGLPGTEIVIVDDQSTDGSFAAVQALAERVPAIRLFQQSANGGQARARNTGLRLSSGRFVCFLDQDDEYAPGFFAKALALLEDDPNLAAVVTDLELIDCEREVHPVQLGAVVYSLPNNVMLRREAAHLIGGFPENAAFRGKGAGEDSPFKQALWTWFNVAYCAEKFLRYRARPGNAFHYFLDRSKVVDGKLVFTSHSPEERSGELFAARKLYLEQVGQRISAVGLLKNPTLGMLYQNACRSPSDIQEHCPTLLRLAKQCQHVTEMGTRAGVSTIAFLQAQPAKLVCYDKVKFREIERLQLVAGRTQFVFHQADVLQVQIEETDLLFIDTWHVYEQLREELRLHAPKVRRFIVLHDTTTFGISGETAGHRGLWPAVEEFLALGTFRLKEQFHNNNGLTILEKI